MARQMEIYFRIAVLVFTLPLAGWTAPNFLEKLKESTPPLEELIPSQEPASEATVPLANEAISAPLIKAVAGTFYRWTIAVAEQQNQLIKHTDPRYQAVKDVFEDITQAAKRSAYGKAASAFDWELNVIDDPSKDNAFAWPGGKVVVYSGALKVATNKAKLAAILGHEILHSLASHTVQRFDPTILKTISIARLARGDALDPDNVPPAVAAAITAVLMREVTVEHSSAARAQELEADYRGLQLAAAAGYDPDEGLLYLSQHLPHVKAERESSVLDQHPGNIERYREVQQHKDELLAIYHKAKSATGKDKSLELLALAAVRR